MTVSLQGSGQWVGCVAVDSAGDWMVRFDPPHVTSLCIPSTPSQLSTVLALFPSHRPVFDCKHGIL